MNQVRENSNKDLLIMKMNEKIESLENAVKNALDQMLEEK